MIIDNTYFVGKILIPNLSNQIAGYNINSLIQDECYSFLASLLGNDIYLDLEKYFDENLDLKTDAPLKYKELLYGKQYDGKTWKGLIIKKGLVKKSILADYVFLKWLEENHIQNSPSGIVNADTKNVSNVNPTEKYVYIWNRIVKYVGISIFKPYRTIYKGVEFVDYVGKDKSQVSLHEFLHDFKEDYPKPQLTTPDGNELRIKNVFGL